MLTPESQTFPIQSSAKSEAGRGPGARVAAIISLASEDAGVTRAAMLGRGRSGKVVAARHAAMWLIRRRGFSTTGIGRVFNNRDHTTVMWGTRAIDRRVAADAAFAARMAVLDAAARQLFGPPP